ELDNNQEGFAHQRRVKWLFNKKSINKKLMTSRLYDSFKGQSTLFTTWYEDVDELVKEKDFLFIGNEFKNRHLDLKEKYSKKLNEGKIKGLNSNKIEDISQKLLNEFFPGIERLGTNNTKGSGDTDLKATLLGGIVVRVQIKNYYEKNGQIEEWVVKQLADSMDMNDNGIILTTTTISEEAKELAKKYSLEGKKISFIDRDDFVNLIFENIDIFSDEDLINLGLKRGYEVL
ncbi:restriction endonuclease, partial [Fusobacterium sp.]|uniref:restriction endonuclease n=1 Tax=Fusobacterium sp. TaxID=68766 RepID=UPI002605055E